MNKDITYFGQTNFRNELKDFGIKRRDRAKHMYIIGKTGMGKTTLLENMAAQDILNGEGIGIIDPHGEFAEKMLRFVPKERIKDVVYFAPHDIDWPVSFNVMENVDFTQRHLVASGLLGVFKKIWPDAFSARMEYILNNAILALLEYPNSTLLGVNRMFSDKAFRNKIVNNVTDPVIKAFWVNEFAKYSDKYMTEATAAIQNKVGQLVSNPVIRNIIGQPKSAFDIRDIMDTQKILIMNLSKGRIGEENSRLLGAMLITKIYLASMSRVDIIEEERKDFYLYVDEFQNFATESFKDILSEARKYRLNLILAHQYVSQMDEKVRDAVFGNVGTMIAFRVGATDAEELEKEFAPEFVVQDIVNLGFASIYLRLMIDGVASKPFSAKTLPPISTGKQEYVKEIVEYSRQEYATSKKEVDEQIDEWHKEEKPVVSSVPNASSVAVSKSLPHTSSDADKPQMFEAECSVCGKKTYVPFEPDGKRPILCKQHRVSGKPAIDEKKTIFRHPEHGTPQQSQVPQKQIIKPEITKSEISKPVPTISPTSGEIVGRVPSRQTISLKDLISVKKDGPNGGKTSPNLTGLRDALREAVEGESLNEKKVPEINLAHEFGHKQTLKPGESIKLE